MPKGSGRRPLPTAVKKLRGNPGKRKLNSAEPIAPAGDPVMPKDLSKAAKAEWNTMIVELRQLGVLSKVDRAALAAYCHAYARWFQAEREVKLLGIVVREPILHQGFKTRFVRYKKNPAVTISEAAMKIMKAFLVEFGMTPSSRSRVRIESPKTEADPMDAYLAGARPGEHVN